MLASSVRLTSAPDVVTIGARSGLLWRGGEVAVAGIGEAFRIDSYDIGRPDDALRLLESIETDEASTVDGPGTGPMAFATFPFDRGRPGTIIVPEVAVGVASDGRRWLTLVAEDESSASTVDAMARIDSLLADRPRAPQPTDYRLQSVVDPAQWRDEIVATTIAAIADGPLEKAVLARELVLTTDTPLDAGAIVDRLRRSFGTANLFLIDGFVGASPETLITRIGSTVRAHPLAGTAPRSSDPAEDQRLSNGLLNSVKDRWEHRITIDWLLDRLLPFCSYVDAEPEPTILTLPNVHHLGTRVEGMLSRPPAGVLELVDALHPTPAVGGQPQALAIERIAEVERMDRGRYAGPTGWVDGAGNGEFAVSVRCAQMDGGTTRLWAGVGIVDQSDPDSELAETRAKFQAMLGALIRP